MSLQGWKLEQNWINLCRVNMVVGDAYLFPSLLLIMFSLDLKFCSILHLIAIVQCVYYLALTWFLYTAKGIFFFPPEDWIACCFHRGFEVKCSNVSIAISSLQVKFFSAISSLTFLKIEMTLGSLLRLQKTSAFHPTVVAYYKYFLWCVSLLHSLPPSPFPEWHTVLFLPHHGCLSAAQS